MTDFAREASEVDLADQATPADDESDEGSGITVPGEADPADVVEQHQSVPSGDDDYQR